MVLELGGQLELGGLVLGAGGHGVVVLGLVVGVVWRLALVYLPGVYLARVYVALLVGAGHIWVIRVRVGSIVQVGVWVVDHPHGYRGTLHDSHRDIGLLLDDQRLVGIHFPPDIIYYNQIINLSNPKPINPPPSLFIINLLIPLRPSSH